MSFSFEKVSVVDKSEYFETTDFSRVRRSQRLDVPISEKWANNQGYFLPSRHAETVQEIENFQVRPDDVWILGFPKTGTTWAQEMVYQICNDFAFQKEKCIELYERSPFLEWGSLFSFKSNTESIEHIANLPSPRVIKTHFAAPLLPKGIWTVKPKIVYLARNFKDAAISYFHLFRNIFGYKRPLDDFLEAFLEDAVIYSPPDAHANDFWNMRNEENIMFLTYEELKRDLPGMIRKVADFLGKPLNEEQVKSLVDHLSFKKMASNDSVNFDGRLDELSSQTNSDRDMSFKFMRKGKIGTFREEMSPEMIEKFDAWIKKRNAENDRDPALLDIFLAQK